MKCSVAVILVALAVTCMVVEQGHALTCVDVDECLKPCVGYLTGQESAPTAICCNGVRKLRTIGTNTAERQFACRCVKQAAAQLPGLKDEAVTKLPSACAVPLPFPISLNFDCSMISV